MPTNPELTAALKVAKTKPMFFAFVAKGSEGMLMVEKKKVPAAQVAAAKKECGGGTIFKGTCQFDGDAMVFEVPKDAPATLAPLIKKIIKADAGQTMNVVVRVNAELEEGETEGTDTTAPPEAPPEAPPIPANDARGPELFKRLNGMSAAIKSALAGANKGQVQALFVSVNAALKNQQHDDAATALDQLEALLGNASGTPPTPPPSTAPQDGAATMKRLNALTPDIKAALAGANKAAVQGKFVAASAFIKNQDFTQADAALDELEALLKGQAPGGISIVKLGKARIEWDQIRLKAIQELQRLQQILQERYQNNPAQKAALPGAFQRVNTLVTRLNEYLGNQLDAVLNADPANRPQLATTAKSAVKRLTDLVDGDRIMQAIDGNEYAPDMNVAMPMRMKLAELAAALG